MNIFKNIRFYLGAGLLIALVSIMWSLPMDLNAAGANGEGLPEVASEAANAKAKAKPESPGGKHPMAGIIGKGGNGFEKKKKIKDHLHGKYKGLEKRPFGARADSRGDGSIEKIRLVGDFTPPGYAKRADVDEDVRARSRAFLTEERQIFGLSDPENELGGGEEVVTEERREDTPARKLIRYHMEVEGLRVSGSTFYFVFNEDGSPKMWEIDDVH